MSEVIVYNIKGESSGKQTLNDAVFGVEIKPEVVQFVARVQRANAHVPYAHTKGRSEVRGGGRKPWRQKGTGNARHGSIRSPLWRKGGVTFGPRASRNMTKKVNKKERDKAMKMMLTDKATAEALKVLDTMDGFSGKTKEMVELLKKLSAEGKSVLVAMSTKNEHVQRAVSNLPKANTVLIDSLNVGDLLTYQYLLTDTAGIEVLEKRYA